MDRKMFKCSDDDFMVQSDDEGEVMQMAKMHGKMKHQMEMSDEEAKSKIQEI